MVTKIQYIWEANKQIGEGGLRPPHSYHIEQKVRRDNSLPDASFFGVIIRTFVSIP